MSDPKRYFPTDLIAIPFTAVSTAFQLVNDTSGPKEYLFMPNQLCHVRRGKSDVSAATTSDLRVLTSGGPFFFWLMPGDGVRVVRSTTDGTLYIGDTSK